MRCFRTETVVLACLIVAATGLRSYQIGRYCFITDEVHSINMATGSERHDMVAAGKTISVPAVFHQLKTRDVHPPIYFAGLNVWLKLFGTSEGAARAFAIPFMIACLPLAFAIVRRLSGPTVALIATAIMAFSPFQIRYTQDLRMYGMVQFFVLLATWLFLGLIADRQHGWRRLRLVAYGLAVALALLVHYFSALVFAFHAGYFLIRRGRLALSPRRFAAGLAIAAVLFAGWWVYAGGERLKNTYRHTVWLEQAPGEQYFGPQLVDVAFYHVGHFTTGFDPPYMVKWGPDRTLMTVGFALLLVPGLAAMARNREWSLLVTLWIAVPFAAMVMADVVTGRHAFHLSRYFIGSALPCYVVIARAFTLSRHRWTHVALGVVLTAVLGGALWRHLSVENLVPPCDKAARAIESMPYKHKAVLYPVMAHAISYYLTDPSIRLQRDFGVPRQELDAFLAGNDEILRIRLPEFSGPPDDLYRRIEARLEQEFTKNEDGSQTIDGVRIDYYTRRRAPAERWSR